MADIEELGQKITELAEAMGKMVEAQESRAIEASARLGEEKTKDKGEDRTTMQQAGDAASNTLTSVFQSGLNSIKSAIANLGVEIARPITEQIQDTGKQISDAMLAGYRAEKGVYQSTTQFVQQLERSGQGMSYSEVQQLYKAHKDMENRAVRGQIKVDKASGRGFQSQLRTEALKNLTGRGGVNRGDVLKAMFPILNLTGDFWGTEGE